MYYDQKPRGLAQFAPASPGAAPGKKRYSTMSVGGGFFGVGGDYAGGASDDPLFKKPSPVDMAQPPAGLTGNIKPPPTLPIPGAYPGQSFTVKVPQAPQGASGLPNQGYGGAPGPGSYGTPGVPANPAQGAVAPTAPAPGGLSGLDPRVASWLDKLDANEKARQEAAANNQKLREGLLAKAQGLYALNPYESEAEARRLAAQAGNKARRAYGGTEDALMRQGGGDGLAGARIDQARKRYGEMSAEAQDNAITAYDDKANAYDWQVRNWETQLSQSDLGSDQLAGLASTISQGAQLPGQIGQTNASIDQTRAAIEQIAASTRMTRAQADEAAWVAQNRGMVALLQLLGQAGPGIGLAAGMR